MKSRNPVPGGILIAVNVLWLASAPRIHADWLAGGNPQSGSGPQPIWRLSDTNGAVINTFAQLTLYHQEWIAMTAGRDGNIYVSLASDINGNQIQCFDAAGNSKGAFVIGPYTNGKLYNPGSLAYGPDGNIYIVDTYWSSILRYSATNGAFLGTFVTGTSAKNLTFGPDGNLYVADANLGVVRYNGTNGAYMDTFVPLGTNGVPDAANLTFGPDGNLYVCSVSSNAVIRFDGQTGRFMDYFVPPGSGGLSAPQWLVFGPDGDLYVASGTIRRYDGRTGAFLNVFGSRADWGLAYLPNTDPPPQLSIQLTATNTVQISWPSAAGTNWVLCCQSGMCITNGWSTVTNPPALVGTNYVVTEPCASTAAFYRLEQQ